MSKSKKSPISNSPQPAHMSEIDTLIEKLMQQKFSVRHGSQTKGIAALEAVLQRQLKTAMDGSPQAQRQVIEQAIHSAEARRAVITEEIDVWSYYKDRKTKELEAHRSAELPEPVIIPHPDDIIIDDQNGVTFDGPLTRDEYDLAHQIRNIVVANLFQEALDHRKSKQKCAPEPKLGDPLTTAMLLNKMLGQRMAFTQDQILDRRMSLAQCTIRELEKQTYQAWKNAKCPRPRGSKGIAPDLMHRIMLMVSKSVKIQSEDLPRAERDRAIDDMLHRLFG